MSNPTFIDCNGLAGFMSFGLVQSGMEMISRTGTLNFGAPVVETNRRHLGNKWDSFFSDDPDEWPVAKADVVAGCPPCSGWSVWSGPANRGPDAKAHEHTRAFMRYAARVKPKIIAFECVQPAYTSGRAVMVKYRDMVEELSGKKYDLYHVKQNNLQLGGFSYRPRYFWVAAESGLKFGAAVTEPSKLPRIMDVIGDLADLPHMWEAQPYAASATPWVSSLLSQSGKVNGHIGRDTLHTQRIQEVFDIIGNEGWPGNRDLGSAVKTAVEMNDDKFPQKWLSIEPRIRRREFKLGFSQPYRWKEDHWCNVLTGSALEAVVHPTQPRMITHREAARIQGLPDDWDIEGARGYSDLHSTWGKAVPLQASKWLGDALVASLNGQPSGDQGELIGEREYLLDLDKGFSRPAVKKRYYPDKIKTVVPSD
jgi:site-specific DNA-cytosine methylase